MALTSRQIKGNLGEELAANWLIGKGYRILERNYRKKYGEIDIVCKKEDQLHFVEVKTVTRAFTPNLSYTKTLDDYEPEDNIHPWKLKRLSRTIQIYLLERRIKDDVDWQLDAVSVYLDEAGNLTKIEMLEDIF
jgi:putative endonuclease